MIPRLPIVVAGVLIFLVVPSFAGFYTDWIWFQQVGFDQLFTRTLSSKLILGGAVFAIAFSVLLGGLRYALRDMTKPYLTLGGGPEVQPLVIDRKGLQLIAAGVSGLAALFMGVFASSQWMVWLQYQHATPFGEVDPLLGRDVAFYVFQLPFLDFIRNLLVSVVVLSLAGATAAYILSGAVGLSHKLVLRLVGGRVSTYRYSSPRFCYY